MTSPQQAPDEKNAMVFFLLVHATEEEKFVSLKKIVADLSSWSLPLLLVVVVLLLTACSVSAPFPCSQMTPNRFCWKQHGEHTGRDWRES